MFEDVFCVVVFLCNPRSFTYIVQQLIFWMEHGSINGIISGFYLDQIDCITFVVNYVVFEEFVQLIVFLVVLQQNSIVMEVESNLLTGHRINHFLVEISELIGIPDWISRSPSHISLNIIVGHCFQEIFLAT